MTFPSQQLELAEGSGLIGRLFLLVFVMLLAAIVVIGFGVFAFKTSFLVGLIAWVTCAGSALLAHISGEYPRGDHNFAARLAIPMVVRTVIPFGVAIWGIKIAQPPLETSLVFYILAFYLVGLVTDVQLTVGRLKPIRSTNSAT